MLDSPAPAVTLPGRRWVRLTRRIRTAEGEPHGTGLQVPMMLGMIPGRPADLGARVVGRTGLVAVGAGHVHPRGDLAAGCPATPGRPARPGPTWRRGRRPNTGVGERAHS